MYTRSDINVNKKLVKFEAQVIKTKDWKNTFDQPSFDPSCKMGKKYQLHINIWPGEI